MNLSNCIAAGFQKSVSKSFVFVLSLLAVTSCDDYVTVDLPPTQLTAAAVFEDKLSANAAMIEVYAKMRKAGIFSGTSSGVGAAMGAYADELNYFGDDTKGISFFYGNALLPSLTDIPSLWNNSYSQIYGANAVIEGVQKSTALSQPDRDQFRGEALFVRALMHFYLQNLYGAIPYITTTDYKINSRVARLSAMELYPKLIADLEEAATLLPEAYISAERVRPNRFAAKALLARVYLYNSKWAEAANEASAVLNQTELYKPVANLAATFKKQSTTTIWQFMPGVAGQNTDEATTFIFIAGPPPLVALTPSLMAAFEPGDLRKSSWTKAVTNSKGTWYHADKYKTKGNSGTSVEYSIVLRLAEQYLIRAEARARQGDLIGAKEDLNVIRTTAGLGNTTAVTATAIIDAVLRERRVELFTEYGHRFFDLKRSGTVNAVLSAVKPGWEATDSLLPLPEAELLVNPNLLPQNPGY
ncbi:RagB/SusD family nutrient uptake outer membrane protein [Flavobacterium sp. GSP11]|uniref:RagB/SusD family nutrient uptake outer membrane protein n=1 Tax=Flavobacterium sp. GSP11 TaxID=3401730 RepID=UPI003AB0A91F